VVTSADVADNENEVCATTIKGVLNEVESAIDNGCV
jgi:hypothetical protein